MGGDSMVCPMALKQVLTASSFLQASNAAWRSFVQVLSKQPYVAGGVSVPGLRLLFHSCLTGRYCTCMRRATVQEWQIHISLYQHNGAWPSSVWMLVHLVP